MEPSCVQITDDLLDHYTEWPSWFRQLKYDTEDMRQIPAGMWTWSEEAGKEFEDFDEDTDPVLIIALPTKGCHQRILLGDWVSFLRNDRGWFMCKANPARAQVQVKLELRNFINSFVEDDNATA